MPIDRFIITDRQWGRSSRTFGQEVDRGGQVNACLFLEVVPGRSDWCAVARPSSLSGTRPPASEIGCCGVFERNALSEERYGNGDDRWHHRPSPHGQGSCWDQSQR
jgi:hypothetical protein